MGLPSKRFRDGDSSSEDDSEMELEELNPEEEEEEDEEGEEEEEEEEDEDEGDEEEEEDKDDVPGKDPRMEELEKEYMEHRNKEQQDLLKNLRSHKDEDLLKGQAVKNQKALWDKTLEFRVLLQKVFSSSNRLPQEPVRSSFSESDDRINVAYSDLITSSRKTLDSLLELQEALLDKNPSAQATNGNPGHSSKGLETSKYLGSEGDEEWLKISQMHSRVAPFRNKSIDKWQRKTEVSTGAAAIKGKLHAFNQNISEQVAAYMRDPSRMIKQMKLRRATVSIFGAVPDDEGSSKEEELQTDGDPELLDDSEFYQQLLKEFFETFDPNSSETALYALQRLKTKKRKIVDRRASKSRKIRFHVHEKIVNFMAPQPMNLPPMAPKLFENLFGLKTHA